MANPADAGTGSSTAEGLSNSRAIMSALEKKVLWLSAWTIHNANHLRPSRDGLKVGGHQASSASVATLMTALYFDVLRPEDRVAVKPHASPVFHAIQYMLGRQSLDALKRFRGLGGAQSYPSRTKDHDEVDFSTGSVGLGVAMTLFSSMVQDYVHLKKLAPAGFRPGRMIAVMGDAELDEGNVYEALLEGWKHDVRNLWWVIDYNRQSLDGVVSDRLFQKIRGFFEAVGWNIVLLKYGKKLEVVFKRPGGEAIREWIDSCPNDLYSALTFKGASGQPHVWRERLAVDLKDVPGVAEILADHDDQKLHELMTNLAGHDMEAVREAFRSVADDTPQCFIAYTIKGYGTPLAGHKDNHAGLMTVAQMAGFKKAMGIPDGREWDPFAGLGIEEAAAREFLEQVPFRQHDSRVLSAPEIAVPAKLELRVSETMSTQVAFGHVLNELGRNDTELSRAIVTTSPDVTVSTNLGPWVNQRGIFARTVRDDAFREEKVVSAQKWQMHRQGQHIELGIAENNLFLLLASLGLSHELFGSRLMPIGTLYDPFIARGLDAMTYALYQDARFILVSTPSGIALAPEGGAHQSITTPLIGLGHPGLSYFEPAYVDELEAILRWSFRHLQEPDGGSVYLRLTTRQLPQIRRSMAESDVLQGAYWAKPPKAGAELALVYVGAVAPEAMEAAAVLAEDVPGIGVLAVTSPSRLYADWRQARLAGGSAHLDRLLSSLAPDAPLVTVMDGHPATLSWLGGDGRAVYPLGVDRFGQSADIPDLFRVHGIDVEAIVGAAAAALLHRLRKG
ncbi:MAG: transketolase [Alphaproteobacteria bacterium]|nr:transketolase [Alphaproteobacteria bacterium]